MSKDIRELYNRYQIVSESTVEQNPMDFLKSVLIKLQQELENKKYYYQFDEYGTAGEHPRFDQYVEYILDKYDLSVENLSKLKTDPKYTEIVSEIEELVQQVSELTLIKDYREND